MFGFVTNIRCFMFGFVQMLIIFAVDNKIFCIRLNDSLE